MRAFHSWSGSIFALLIAVESTTCSFGQVQVGSTQANTTAPIPVPVQSYAVIDVSGASSGSNPVSMITLDDSNNVAFGFGVGDSAFSDIVNLGAPWGGVFGYGDGAYEEFYVYTWQNGTLGSEESTNCDESESDWAGNQYYEIRFPRSLLSTGTLFGDEGAAYLNPNNPNQYYYLQWDIFQSENSQEPTPINNIDNLFPLPCVPMTDSVSQTGVLAGGFQGGQENPGVQGFLYNSGVYTVFSSQGQSFHGEQAVQANFAPGLVNNNAWAIGSDGANHCYAIWTGNGNPIDAFGSDTPNAINNQNQVTVESAEGWISGIGYGEGYLWEPNGNGSNPATTRLNSMLPGHLQGQVVNVQPYAISDQLTPVPLANADASIQILANTINNNAPEPFLFKRDNSENWTSAEIQVPEGYNIGLTGINSNGIISALGTTNSVSTVSHALLLLPVQVNSVSFSGTSYCQLESDDASKQYVAPQWTGTSNTSGLGDQNYAVAYTKNSTPKVAATFKIPTGLGVTSVQIKASGPDSFGIPATTETVGSGGVITLPATSSTSTLPNSIKYYNKADSTAFTINWQISLDGGNSWAQISTSHTVYVTLATPVTALSQESLFEIGCREANDMKGDPNNLQDRISITNAIWTDFSNLKVQRVDGTVLTYYHDYNTLVTTTEDLLAGGDGECNAWSKLFIDIRKAQGLTEQNNYIEIVPTAASGFIINNWNFAGQGTSGIPAFPFLNLPANPWQLANGYAWNYAEVSQGTGVPAQGNRTPGSLFKNHRVVSINGQYYDPSYGEKPKSLQDFENNYIAGFFAGPATMPINGANTSAIIFNKTPQGLNITALPPSTY